MEHQERLAIDYSMRNALEYVEKMALLRHAAASQLRPSKEKYACRPQHSGPPAAAHRAQKTLLVDDAVLDDGDDLVHLRGVGQGRGAGRAHVLANPVVCQVHDQQARRGAVQRARGGPATPSAPLQAARMHSTLLHVRYIVRVACMHHTGNNG